MDLISRQAAIDAVMELFRRVPTNAIRAKKVIEKLPSAQPERWIPCSERLPEHRLYVLVTYEYEYGLIDNGITWYSGTENKWNTSREVIAWIPLPEPYRGEEK